MFNRNFMETGKFKKTLFVAVQEKLKEIKRVLICNSCGGYKFDIEVETSTHVSKGVFGTEFGVLSGNLSGQDSIVTKAVCEECGEVLDFSNLKEAKYCQECGNPLGKIYRKNKLNGTLYHLSCGLQSMPESLTEIVYEE